MLELLEEAEKRLPYLLQDRDAWKSLFIDYHPPFVERLWIPFINGSRLSLHRIHPCNADEALFHPHPWPSAMKIIRGTYEMAIGYGTGNTPPPVAALLINSQGSSYEMTDPNAWHYVRPLGTYAHTIMVTGIPWTRESPQPDKALRPLTPEEKDHLFSVANRRYTFA